MLFVETNRLVTTKPYKFDIKCQCNSESYEHHIVLGTKTINRPSVAGTVISRPGGYELYRLASSMPESSFSSKHVMCHVSCVMCHVSLVIFLLIYIYFRQSKGATRWSVCYQRGLPRLVCLHGEVLLTTLVLQYTDRLDPLLSHSLIN